VGGVLVKVGRERLPEGVVINSLTLLHEFSASVAVGLQGLCEDGFFLFALVDIVFALYCLEHVVVIARLAVLSNYDCGNGKWDSPAIQVLDCERLSFRVANLKGNNWSAVPRDFNPGDFGLEALY